MARELITVNGTACLVTTCASCKLGDKSTAKVGGPVALTYEIAHKNYPAGMKFTVERMVKTRDYGVVLHMVGGFSINARLCCKA